MLVNSNICIIRVELCNNTGVLNFNNFHSFGLLCFYVLFCLLFCFFSSKYIFVYHSMFQSRTVCFIYSVLYASKQQCSPIGQVFNSTLTGSNQVNVPSSSTEGSNKKLGDSFLRHLASVVTMLIT